MYEDSQLLVIIDPIGSLETTIVNSYSYNYQSYQVVCSNDSFMCYTRFKCILVLHQINQTYRESYL